MLSVLLVEDNKDLALSIIDHFEYENIICDYASDGIKGFRLSSANKYDVIILDINMDGLDGLALCEKIRFQGNDTPILMLTARDTLDNKQEGFDAGTDDYLTKPFEVEELIMRVNALAKRKSGQVSTLTLGPLHLNLKSRTGELNQHPIKLTPTVFTILEILLRASPNAVSQTELTQKLWGDQLPDSNKLRVHIHNLRKILSQGQAEHVLKTVPGYGFSISHDK